VAFSVSAAVSGVERVGLLENGGEALQVVDGKVSVPLSPYEIVTLRLRF
jgi:hypothetical protein